MFELLKIFFLAFYSFLPDSPFQTMLNGEVSRLDFLPYLNWFVPFDNCLKVTEMWLACVTAYHLYRYIKSTGKKLFLDKIFG